MDDHHSTGQHYPEKLGKQAPSAKRKRESLVPYYDNLRRKFVAITFCDGSERQDFYINFNKRRFVYRFETLGDVPAWKVRSIEEALLGGW